MPAKIRLQRKGKKGQPFYNIIIADGRAPRDGRFIEKIGTYNPLTKPAEIEIHFEKALEWLHKGAQPTDTVRAILSYKGVLFKSHLLQGVKKGALTPEMAEAKFQAWLTDKQAKIAGLKKENELSQKESRKKQLAEETAVNEAKAGAISKKLAKAAEEASRAAAEKAAIVPEAPAAAHEAAVPEAIAPEASASEAAVPEAAAPAEEPKQE
jgi:small subunit ribosomal protein S16